MVVLAMTMTKLTWLRIGSLMLAVMFGFPVPGAPQPEAKREEPDRVINIVAERFTFVPSRIKLRKGEVVELRIRSLDTNHGFRIREAGADVTIPKRGRGDARILFRAQERGVFEFECSKPCGAGHTMMRGRIVVK